MAGNRLARALLLAAWLPVLAACRDDGPSPAPALDGSAAAAVAVAAPGDVFSDDTVATGLDFVHQNGMSGERYIVEMMGPGAALVDFDNDGDLDVFLRQGAFLATAEPAAGSPFPAAAGAPPAGDRLYRNDLEVDADGSRTLTFTDVSAASGFAGSGGSNPTDYGLGVAAGDFDNDGWVDLYCTNFGPNRLWRNRGGDRPGGGDGPFFEDVTAASGTGDGRWSGAAVFADLDRDGWLDLWVGNYIDFTLKNHRSCFQPSSAPDYCGPLSYRPQPDRLFRNRGGGRGSAGAAGVIFEDVTAGARMASAFGNALGVLATDFDDDGWPDLFVANDAVENQLWRNRGGDGGGMTFEDEALLRGCALNGAGEREGSMGVDAGDFDGDGDLDLFVTHMATETNTLYVNEGQGVFRDGTLAAGLATPSRPLTGFGTGFLDYDNDGWLDLLVVNGAVLMIPALERAGDPYPLHQTNQLYRNLRGDGPGRSDGPDVRFAAVDLGELASQSDVSRGLALGDLDNDGDLDAVIVNNRGRARLWRNRLGQENRWLGLRLLDRDGRRLLTDVRVTVLRPGDRPLVRRAHRDGSYASSRDPRVVVGLGPSGTASAVRVRWPDGGEEEFIELEVGAYHSLVRGRGRPLPAAPAGEAR